MTCPFKYMFNSSGPWNCFDKLCRAWDAKSESCSLLLPFIEFAKDIEKERVKKEREGIESCVVTEE